MDTVEFTIEDVLRIDEIPIYKVRGQEHYFLCPSCQKAKADEKCSANTLKNKWGCFRCGRGGGALSLHMAYTGIDDPKEAIKDLYRRVGENIPVPELVYSSAKKESKPVHEGVKVDKRRHDRVYRAMNAVSSLSKKHMDNLTKRGLTEQDIADGMFFDLPKDGYAFCRKLVSSNLIQQYELDGIAGLYDGWNGEKTSAAVKSGGFFCPVWDYIEENGTGRYLIKAGQVAQPEKAKHGAPKYIWYSSSEREGGVSSGAQCSVLKGSESGIVLITEGTLKAYVTWCLLKRRVTVISVPGVRALLYLKAELMKPYVVGQNDVVITAYDMDRKHLTAEATHKAYEKRDEKYKDYNYTDYSLHLRDKADDIEDMEKALEKLVKSTGHFVTSVSWDVSSKNRSLWNGKIKGIDDLLNGLSEEGKESFYNFLKKKASDCLLLAG